MQLKLGQKVTLLVAVPFLASVFWAGFSLIGKITQRQEALRMRSGSEFSVTASRLIHQLQKERGKTALYVSGKAELGELNTARANSDAPKATMEKALTLPYVSASITEPTKQAFEGIESARRLADRKAPNDEVIAAYTGAIRKLIDVQVKGATLGSVDGLETRMLSLTALELAKENAGRLRANMSRVIAEDKPITIQTVTTLETLKSGITANIDSPAMVLSEQANKELQAIRAGADWKEVFRVYDVVIAKSATGRYGEDPQAYFGKITAMIDRLDGVIENEGTTVRAEVGKIYTRATIWFGFILFALLGMGGALVFFAYLFIRGLNRQVEGVAQRLGQGANTIATSTHVIAERGKDLSDASREQASLVQETVAAAQEFAATAQKNAENARRAESSANQSKTAAHDGRQIVTEMVDAIHQIKMANENLANQSQQSNEELSQIVRIISEIGNRTNVINEIVFQTKLLSFNASVEAARAGEAGKGFAVVAEEVGKLAQMSGDAAKEISKMLSDGISKVQTIISQTQSSLKRLTQDSEVKVEEGIKVSERCGQAFEALVQNMDSVSLMSSDVAAASEEQKYGVDEITKAMTELEQMNERNAMGADHSAASTAQLAKEAENLREVVADLMIMIHGNAAGRTSGDTPASGDGTKVVSASQDSGSTESVPNADDNRFAA